MLATPGPLSGQLLPILGRGQERVIPRRCGYFPQSRSSRQAGRTRKGNPVIVERPKRPERAPYSPEIYCEVKARLAAGEYQHDIAADLGWNQGRVSEVKTGKRGGNPAQPTLF